MNRHNNGRTPEVFSRRIIVEREQQKADAEAKAAYEAKVAQELVRRAERGLPLEDANMKRLCLDVTPAFRKAIRLEAAQRGVTMTALILDALHAFGIRE